MRVLFAALAMAALAGCSEGSYSEQEKRIRIELANHFAEMNADASAAVQAAKATDADYQVSPTALNTNRFEWDAAGSVYEGVVCPNGACGAELGMLASAVSDELRCPECNQKLSPEKAKPMFEIRSGTSMPIVILVRYIRRGLAYDPSSMVKVSSRIETEHPISTHTDPLNRRKEMYAAGFYRVVTSSLCTTAFVFKGGDLRQVDPENVRKMMGSSDQVSASGLKLGRWPAIEEPLKPWLGKAPVKAEAPKEEPKSP